MNTIMALTAGTFRWVLQVSWQSAVLAILVVIVQLSFRKKLSPTWRYGLWLLVVARLLMPVAPESAVSIYNFAKLASREPRPSSPIPESSNVRKAAAPETRAISSTSVGDNSPLPAAPAERSAAMQQSNGSRASAILPPRQERKKSVNWFALASGIWLAGVCVLGARLIWANLRFRSRLIRHLQASDAAVEQLLQECARILEVRVRLSIIETREVESPAVWGLLRKHLLLPAGAFERFSKVELRHIFLHELAHVKRRDLEINCLAGILQILHWFNPVLWLAFARMRADRELATDALALARTDSREAVGYGETILKVLEGLVGKPKQPGLVGIAESKARMKERMLAIVNRDAVRPWKWAAVAIAAVLAGIGLTNARQSHEPSATAPRGPAQNSFSIRVMDYDSGKPLAGVAVSFSLDYYGGNSKKLEASTDKDGRAVIELSRVDLKHLAYQMRKTNYLSLRGDWFDQQLSSLGDEYELKLAQGVEIGGKVTDENGKPIADAEVCWDEAMNMLLYSDEPRDFQYARKWGTDIGEHVTTTDSQGEWKAKCVWPTVQWASFRVHHPDFADATCSTGINDAMQAEGRGKKTSFDDLVHRRVTLQMSKGVTLKGRVVNEAGEQLAGIQVNYFELQLRPHSTSDQLLGKRTTNSDSAGKFQFEHVPNKHIYLLVQTAGYGPTTAELEPKPSPEEVEMRLVKGRNFAGQIVDKNENPIPGAQVKVADFSIWRGLHWETITDDQGRIEWKDAPTEKFQLALEKDGFITQQKIVQASEKEMKIRLNRTLKITGKVSDAESKESVKSFRIEWLDRGDPKEFEQGYRFSTIPGSNGLFTVDVGRLYAETWYRGYAHQCILRVQADGYLPTVSRVFSASDGDVGEIAYNVELKRARQIEGIIVDSAGNPVSGAQVALKIPSSKLRLSGQTSFTPPVAAVVGRSDAEGKFRLNDDPAGQGLVAVHEKGFAELGTNELSENLTVRLQAWGKLKGSVWDYDKPLTNQQVWVNNPNRSWPQSFVIHFSTNTDAHGEFAFDMVPPGKYAVFRMIPMENGASSGPQEIVRVEPGATAEVKVGGTGRAVVGKFKITNPYVAIDWVSDKNHPYAHSIFPQTPENLKTPQQFEAWRNQPEIQRAYDAIHNYPLQMVADGAFRIDEVVSGKYEIQLQLYDPRDSESYAYGKVICNAKKSFEVPGSNDRSPLDLGEIEISLKADIKKGQTAAPDFEATDMAGEKFKLSDFHGKYVLLDFWATWCGPCIGEFPYLKQVHDKFKDRKDFVMTSFSLDKTINEPREFLKKNELPWRQGYLGEWSQTKVPEQYGVQGIPAIFLVSPEGKIIETELEGSSMVGRVEKYLK